MKQPRTSLTGDVICLHDFVHGGLDNKVRHIMKSRFCTNSQVLDVELVPYSMVSQCLTSQVHKHEVFLQVRVHDAAPVGSAVSAAELPGEDWGCCLLRTRMWPCRPNRLPERPPNQHRHRYPQHRQHVGLSLRRRGHAEVVPLPERKWCHRSYKKKLQKKKNQIFYFNKQTKCVANLQAQFNTRDHNAALTETSWR